MNGPSKTGKRQKNEMRRPNILVFTDLDGTLLDHNTYSFDAAGEALSRLQQGRIPLIICSSKTRAEIEAWRERLNVRAPFTSENGGGIFFSDMFNLVEGNYTKRNGLSVIDLGTPYPQLVARFKALKDMFGSRIKGFSEMEIEELVDLTGLTHQDAALAKKREYSEPFLFDGNKKDQMALEKTITDLNLQLTKGGRFSCLMGDNDKGKAVHIVAKMYRETRPGLKTIAFGDSYNDLPMLKAVDIPILVQKPDGTYEKQIDIPNLRLAPGIGPIGWNKALLTVL